MTKDERVWGTHEVRMGDQVFMLNNDEFERLFNGEPVHLGLGTGDLLIPIKRDASGNAIAIARGGGE